MRDKRLNNRRLAELSGVAESRISQHRSGVHLLSLYDTVRIAAALKTSIDYLAAIDVYVSAKIK